MSRRRKYSEDLTYAEWHRLYLEHLYPRIGHRQDMADRDWTEFCHHCKDPLALIEEVRDVGQDLADKATTVTRKLAVRANVPSFLLAWRTDRPSDIQERMDRLNREVRQLEACYSITYFTAKALSPVTGKFERYSPEDWAKFVLSIHRRHDAVCRADGELPINQARLWEYIGSTPLYVVQRGK